MWLPILPVDLYPVRHILEVWHNILIYLKSNLKTPFKGS